MTDNSNMELLVQQEGHAVQVVMNRPKALNALSFEMIRGFSANLSRWEADDNVKCIVISGIGDRAFCAGGDVKSTYMTGLSYQKGEIDERSLSLFFYEEYQLNRQLYHFQKPLLAFMNGITMGGGFGVAGPCRYKIASERTVFAMPEVAIGLFPDVGSMYFLSRCPGEVGAYLALTGNKITAEDMLYCGLATHYIPADRQGECQARLQDGGDIDAILSEFHKISGKNSELQENIEIINKCFKGSDVEAIIAALRECGSVWSLAQADIIETRSPVSLKVSLSHLRMMRNKDFNAVIAQDFVLVQHFMKAHDFYEGVRAVLVDKDYKPQWKPERLRDVSDEVVQGYFNSTGLTLPLASIGKHI